VRYADLEAIEGVFRRHASGKELAALFADALKSSELFDHLFEISDTGVNVS
jgi:hypothetical protein